MKWIVNDDLEFDNEPDVVEWIITDGEYDDNDSGFNEWLDEAYGEIDVCGETYWSSYVLENTDHDRYLQAREEWKHERMEADREDLLYQLGRMGNGTEIWFFDYCIKCEDDCVNEEEERILDELLNRIDGEFK